MEWAKQTEEMFKNWTDIQRKTWESWLEAIRGFDKSQGTQVWEKTMDAWQESVKKALEAQVDGSRILAENMAATKGTPKEAAEWAQQLQEMTNRWAEVQQQLWNNWFEVVKKVDPSKLGGSWDKEGPNVFKAWQEVAQKALNTQAEWTRTWTAGQTKKES